MVTPTTQSAKGLNRQIFAMAAVLICTSLTGCTALFSPIDSIPASRVPPQFLAEPQANKVPIDVARLRQPKPEFYTLDAGDVMGIFIEGVLGKSEEAPPVNLSSPDSDLPPAIGFPIPIREDGTIQLPLIKPIPLRGLTVQQAEALIQRAYRDGEEPILPENPRIIVTILKERTFRVFVVRQDNSLANRNQQFQGNFQVGGVFDRSDFSSRGFVLRLPAYQNDVLNALSQTGGMPGVNAKPEIKILRGTRLEIEKRDQQLAEFYRTNKPEDFPYGVVPSIPDETSSIKIPMRLIPGQTPNFRPEDIILRDGDIVYVESRETEVYYTSGLLGGGEFPIPRDFDLDVLQAISLGRTAGFGSSQSSGLIGGAAQNVPPTELIVLRQIPGRRQLAIRIDMTEAVNDPRQRLYVKKGDVLLLRFKPQEEIINFASGVFYTFGVSRLFNPR